MRWLLRTLLPIVVLMAWPDRVVAETSVTRATTTVPWLTETRPEAKPHADTTAKGSEDDDPRWATITELTLTDASGNQNLTVFTTGFTLKHLRTEHFAFELELQGRYGSSDGEQVAESYKGAITFDFTPNSRWSPFVHTTAEHDPFRRLDIRANTGAGARWRVYRERGRGEADLSVSMMHSYETLANDEGSMSTARARWNVRVNGSRQVRDGVTLSHRTQYQPVADELGDYQLSTVTGLRVHLSRRIALSVSHEYNRDTRPAESVRPDDRLLKAGVQVEI